MLREQKGKTVLVQFPGPRGTICSTLKFCTFFGRTISVTSGVSKKKQKTLTQEKRRLKMPHPLAFR